MDRKNIDKEIAARCKGKLTEKRIKMNAVSKALGISDNTIYQKMLGHNSLSVGELARIAMFFNFTREDVNFIIFG